MKNIRNNSRQFQSVWKGNARKIFLLLTLGIATVALATPPLGFIVNQILAKGVVPSDIRQQIEITRNPDGSVEPWEAELHAHGSTDFYIQHLVLAPGGYSGWHTHPGILIGTVTAGGIDFYDANCRKRSVAAGEVYFENGNVHGIVNTGSVNADLSIAYLIKHNAPRRLEADAPTCAVSTPIP
jgi:quercetin dioxygenase-like cupin family protein